MRALVLLAVISAALTACSDAVDEKRSEAEFIENTGSQRDVCDAYKRLEDAARTAKNEEAFLEAKIKGGTACGNDRSGFDPRLSNQIEADNMMPGT